MRRPLLVLAITLMALPAVAHVAPSVDDNNRMVKLTPLGDRVRVTYTVFYGEIPGHLLRAELDTDHDQVISDAEGQAFGAKLATEVAAAIDVAIDDKQLAFAWSEVSVGLGSPGVDAGAFSIDLVGWLCLPTLRGKHHVLLHDRFRLTQPGETEVKVEDTPGVTIEHARVGTNDDPSFDYKFVGPGGPLSDDGLDLVFTAGDRAPVGADGRCVVAGGGGPGAPVAIVAIVVVVGIGGAGVVVMRRRRRPRRR